MATQLLQLKYPEIRNYLGGAFVDRDQALELKNRRQSTAIRLKESIEKIHSYGCVVKDLDIGTIQKLANSWNVDLIILFAQNMSVNRNRWQWRSGPSRRFS